MSSNWIDYLVFLTFAAAGVTILGAVPRALQATRDLWKDTGGRRKSQAVVLDKLACGSSQLFVDELLGTPQFFFSVDGDNGQQQRIHRLRGAWVTAEYEQGSLYCFSITIIKESMSYDISRLTFGMLRGRLGNASFSDVVGTVGPNGVSAWLSARRSGYSEHYYFGNPGGYQEFWVSANECGAGRWKKPPPSEYRDGSYRSLPDGTNEEPIPDRAAIPANTLTVLGPNAPGDARERLLKRYVLGADMDVVRLDVRDHDVKRLKKAPRVQRQARFGILADGVFRRTRIPQTP